MQLSCVFSTYSWAPCNKTNGAYPCGSVLPLGRFRQFIQTKLCEKSQAEICERKTWACPSTTAVNKGNAFRSAQGRSVNLVNLIYCAAAARGSDRNYDFIIIPAYEKITSQREMVFKHDL